MALVFESCVSSAPALSSSKAVIVAQEFSSGCSKDAVASKVVEEMRIQDKCKIRECIQSDCGNLVKERTWGRGVWNGPMEN